MLQRSKESLEKPARRWPRIIAAVAVVVLLAATAIATQLLPVLQTQMETALREAGYEPVSSELTLGWRGLTAKTLTLTKDQERWELEGVSALPSYSTRALSIHIDQVRYGSGNFTSPPFSLAVDAKLINGSSVEFEATARDIKDKIRITSKGAYNYRQKTYVVDATLEDVTFETGVLQPDEILPQMRGKLTNVSGTLSGQLHLDPTASTGIVHMKKLSGMAGDTLIAGMNGMIVFDSLSPLTTPSEQVITIDMLTAGLPLRNGAVVFQLTKDGMLKVEPTRWSVAGGHVSTDHFNLNTSSLTIDRFTLRADSLSLEELLAGVLQSGVTATGNVNGSIPITINHEGTPLVHDATLQTEKGGVITYTPAADAPLQKGNALQTDILLQALENFHYTDLSMKLNSEDKEKLAIDLHVKGSNPDLYEGKPIELNVHLTGDILGLVQSSLDVYNLPEQLQEQFLNGTP